MDEAGMIDPVAIERLKRLGGSAFVLKMLELFRSYGAEKLAAAQRAQSEGNRTGVADAVHPLRSSAGNVGAQRVQVIAQQIEEQARSSGEQTQSLCVLMNELAGAFEVTQRELEKLRISLSDSPAQTQ